MFDSRCRHRTVTLRRSSRCPRHGSRGRHSVCSLELMHPLLCLNCRDPTQRLPPTCLIRLLYHLLLLSSQHGCYRLMPCDHLELGRCHSLRGCMHCYLHCFLGCDQAPRPVIEYLIEAHFATALPHP